MVKIIDKINQSISAPFFSFEFFPPKTEAGVENLYLRMDRMTALQPIFVDITWGAGGCTRDLTMAISEYTQTYFGVDALMHLTCTNLTLSNLKDILKNARELGIQNILALRGDPPKGALQWEPIPGGCNNAIDLVKLIRKEHGEYFGIAVAGFPEGHPHSKESMQDEVRYLKQKVDAGADFVLTQFFYDPDVFIEFLQQCRDVGIRCPIIPGMMPIQSYSSFKKMTGFCRTKVPDHIWESMRPVMDDDEQVKEYGIQLCTQMCQLLTEKADVQGFHFYTLNLEKSVMSVLRQLGVENSIASRRAFPWRGSRVNIEQGKVEDVRPIHWANRPKSYIKRTITWDEFPNGRWGDNRSPAFGELSDSHFFRPVEGSKEDLLAIWGDAPVSHQDVYEVFARFVEGRIPILPWCESALHSETSTIVEQLANINRAGFLTINSQPAVNGSRSDHPIYGWGGLNGRVYQKAYLEFFASPELLKSIMEVMRLPDHSQLSFYAINSDKVKYSTSGGEGISNTIALTWGVFPNKEILQPTVFDHDSFVVWSDEVFQLWIKSWAHLYDDGTVSSDLIYEIHDTYFLVAIIDNEYIDSTLFELLPKVLEHYRAAGADDEATAAAPPEAVDEWF